MKRINEQEIINKLISYCQELKAQWDLTHDLRKVSQWSYQQRESGRDVPYMGISQGVKGSKKIIGLWCQPIAKQKEYTEFFNIKAPECNMLDKYTLLMYLEEEGLLLAEKTGKGREKYNVLYQADLLETVEDLKKELSDDNDQEILEELIESLSPNRIRNYAINAEAGKALNNPLKFVSNEVKAKVSGYTNDECLLIVAKKYFNYKG